MPGVEKPLQESAAASESSWIDTDLIKQKLIVTQQPIQTHGEAAFRRLEHGNSRFPVECGDILRRRRRYRALDHQLLPPETESLSI